MLNSLQKLIRETVSQVLKENYALDPNMVPQGIRAWVEATLGRKIRKYSLVQTGEVNIGMPVFEADREIYQMFRLENGNAIKMDDVKFYRSGWEGDGVQISGHRIDGKAVIPSGHVLVKASTYLGNATLYTADDAQKLLPPAPSEGEELSDLELLALYQAKSLIASYRHKFKPEVYARLMQLGLMASNKSITIKGKNALQYPQNQERLGHSGDKLMHLIEPWRKMWSGGAVNEGITPERRAEAVAFAKDLKRYVSSKYGIKQLSVSIGKSVMEDPYIMVAGRGESRTLPEEFRRDCIILVYGPEEAHRDWIGNIAPTYVTMHWSQWQKLVA